MISYKVSQKRKYVFTGKVCDNGCLSLTHTFCWSLSIVSGMFDVRNVLRDGPAPFFR
jgi:hypothetical protein